jgi:hypothetical protein
MAVLNICATLTQGLDSACPTNVVRKYYQQTVIINHSDVDKSTIVKTVNDTNFKVAFRLKTGKTGYRFTASESGSSISAMYEKTTNEGNGLPQYIHKMNYVAVGASELIKATLNKLDRGSFVVAGQLKNGLVEILGFENGLVNGDYTFDLQGANGSVALVLTSQENAPEPLAPYIYTSTDPELSFDTLFA